MKLVNKLVFSFNDKKWGTIALLGIINFLPVSASQGQNISVQVDSYMKAQVKEATLSGTILVAENMIDWFSQTKAAPVTSKKIVRRTAVKPPNQVVVKAKYPFVAKAIKCP